MKRRCSHCGKYRQVTLKGKFAEHVIEERVNNPERCEGSGKRIKADAIGFAVNSADMAAITYMKPECWENINEAFP